MDQPQPNPPAPASAAAPAPTPAPAPPDPLPRNLFRNLLTLRREISFPTALLLGLLCIAVCFGLWWFVTWGESEERMMSPTQLPSPGEVFASFHSLWFERELTWNLIASLRRVVLGFGLAAIVGLPLGVLCGCFPAVNAFFAPLNIFGRNIPVAALVFLMYALFGIGEEQKVMFIFFASVAFVISDTARAVSDVGSHYIDTAYTLGASRWQVIIKVLVPLAMPSVFNSLRLLFGLAFGYIMLAESIKIGSEAGGLGDIIITSQRRGPREHIILVLLIIPVVALCVDRFLFWMQRELFPHRYGGHGYLNAAVRAVLHGWESLKAVVRPAAVVPGVPATSDGKKP